VLFFEDLPWTSHSVAHFDTFVKVDTFYYRKEDIQPSVWLKNIKIIHDSSGLVHEVQKKSMSLSYQLQAEDIEIWRNKFFAYIHEAYRRAMRNEVYYALHCIDNLRLSMTTAWYMEAGIQPNTFGDWSKIEGERSCLCGWQLSLLGNWHCDRKPKEILRVIKSVIPEFINVHKSLCRKCDIEENTGWVNEILDMVR
ncbi:MAG: hypothetical protein WCF60_03790, partial [Anaerobacillus sp.]